MKTSKKKTISIIGLGRVGLPLLLYLEKKGFKLLGIDNNYEVVKSLKLKKMPFSEKGCDKLIKRTKAVFTTDIKILNKIYSDYIFVTVGTPLRDGIEVDLSSINKVLSEIIKIFRKGQTLIMRSTVSPDTTEYIKNFINKNTKFKVGKDIFLSYCPERIAENHALKELASLPQIIGVDDEKSFQSTKKIFQSFKVKIFKTNYLSAELVKLFNNNLRYIEFAIANQFAILANNFGQNIFDIIEMCNFQYPRGRIFKPGLTGGTCLRKDFGMLNERNPNSDLFLAAWKINEYMPYHLVNATENKIKFKNKVVGILGYTFKKNSDDLRESLVPKLVRQIEKKVPKKIIISDPRSKKRNLGNYVNSNYEGLIKNSDIIFIAINHDNFSKKNLIKLAKKKTLFIDIWNHLKENTFFYSK